MLGPIISLGVQRGAVFRPAPSTLHPANRTALKSTPHDLHLDPKMRKWISKNLGWVPDQLSATEAPKGIDAASTSADSTRIADESLPELLLRDLSILGKKTLSSREQHEYTHWVALEPWTLSDAPYAKINRIMLQRCKKRYLFDCEKNRDILTDDPWLQDVWLWIEGLSINVATEVTYSHVF